MALRNKRSDSEQIAALTVTLQQRTGQRLSASDLRLETGVAKNRVRKLLRRHPRVRISEKSPYEFSWDETGEALTFPMRSFSWEVLSRRVAKKKLDRSAFLHNGTGVPAAVTWFFGISEGGPRFPEVSLVFDGKTFDARITVENKGRYRLFWRGDFASALGQAFPDSLSRYQQKLNPNQNAWIKFEKVSTARYEVEFSQEIPRKYFALLANPNRYRIEEAIHEREEDAWITGAKNMQLGDQVIIWKAKGRKKKRGIVALGQVISGPEVSSDADNPYWIDPPSEPKERVKVRYEVPEGLPLWLGGDHDQVLESLSVSRGQGTVFNVTPEQWSAVEEAVGGKTTPTWLQPEDDAKPARRRSQGRGLSPGKRKAIEEWAVRRAIERFSELNLEDVGSTKSWDLEDDTSVDSPVRIEVKGSTLRLGNITLTDNEVEHAKKARDEGVCRLILVVVEEIELRAGGGEDDWIASGGKVRVCDPWEIDEDGLDPVQWRYRL